MNARVSCEVIGGPLSDTASRIGRAGSSTARSRRWSVNRSTSPRLRACSKTTTTWVEVSSIDTRVSIHLRETMSTIANTARFARVKCVTSQIQIRFGSHTSQSGHGRFSDRPWRQVGQHKPVSSQNTPERRRCDPHETLVGTAVSELAVRPVDLTPLLGHGQDGLDLGGQDAMRRVPARRPSTSVPWLWRWARQRWTRSSETCHNEHAQR